MLGDGSGVMRDGQLAAGNASDQVEDVADGVVDARAELNGLTDRVARGTGRLVHGIVGRRTVGRAGKRVSTNMFSLLPIAGGIYIGGGIVLLILIILIVFLVLR